MKACSRWLSVATPPVWNHQAVAPRRGASAACARVAGMPPACIHFLMTNPVVSLRSTTGYNVHPFGMTSDTLMVFTPVSGAFVTRIFPLDRQAPMLFRFLDQEHRTQDAAEREVGDLRVIDAQGDDVFTHVEGAGDLHLKRRARGALAPCAPVGSPGPRARRQARPGPPSPRRPWRVFSREPAAE